MENNKGVSKATSNRHLPEDLCSEILSNLPVKSLVRFRCVSKSWLSLIEDPDFARLHMKKFNNNRDETTLLVLQGTRIEPNCVLRCSDTFKTISESLHTFSRDTEEGRWDVECSIDGLVLLKSRFRGRLDYFKKLRVWNPSIRKFHNIPSLPGIDRIPYDSSDVNIGLGYDPLIKDYKLVKLVFWETDTLQYSFAVYTLGAGSWRIIPFQGKGLSDWHWMLKLGTKSVYLQGSLYFIAKDRKRKVMELVSVDLSSEVFSCTSLPNIKALSWSSLSLVDDGCRLALLDFWGHAMWALGSESGPMIWTKRYSFALFILTFLYHKKNGDMLIRMSHVEMPSSEEESVSYCNLLVSYNLETQRQKTLMNIMPFEIDIYNVCGYVESLVLV